MVGFVVLAWRPQDQDGAALAQRLAALLDAEQAWSPAGRSARWAAWRSACRGPRVDAMPGDRGLLVGEVHGRIGEPPLTGERLAAITDRAPQVASGRLAAQAWGRYLAVFTPPDGSVQAFRDPSGALEAFAWRRGRVDILASTLDDLPSALGPDRLAIDWDALARLLRAPGRVAREDPLEGIRTLRPGMLEQLDGAGSARSVWSPASFLATRIAESEAAAELVRRVDAVVAAMAGPRRRLLVELSGGLDSAIVGSALAAEGLSGRVAAWINYYDSRREGDERSYARAVARRLGVSLEAVPLAVEPLDEADLDGLARGVRPPMIAIGRRYDADMAARAAASGADAILTGQGGDAVFFQMPSPLVVADAVRLGGMGALRSGILGDVARWTRRPAGRVLATAFGALHRPSPLPIPPALPGLRPDVGAPPHPWLAEVDGAPPAKRLQVAAVAQAALYAGDSSRRRVAEVLQPLFSQPILELVLAIPAPVLTRGGRDRALARSAFADRLPAEVIGRRSKGSLGGYYVDVVLASLDFLRPHLLDGCLCDAGLIERDRLAAALTPEHLVWHGRAAPILAAALTESWVRHWQGRAPDSLAAPRTRYG